MNTDVEAEEMVVAVFYGGRTCEHDVSIITGIQAAKLLEGKHTVLPVYITREGRWIVPSRYDDVSSYRGEKRGAAAFMRAGSPCLCYGRGRKKKIDVALLCVHGAGGEDGALQGILEASGVAYTGSGIAASAVGLDKRLSKRLFASAGLDVVEWTEASRFEYENDLKAIIGRMQALGGEVIVKPSSLGSSIGISLARSPRELMTALSVAFEWDDAVVIERLLRGFIELNVAVWSDGRDLHVSLPERPRGRDEFLSYADKYVRGAYKGGAPAREFPALIDEALSSRARLTAEKVYRAIGAAGMARVDLMYDEAADKLYVNEINTVPGSLALYFFANEKFFLKPQKCDMGCENRDMRCENSATKAENSPADNSEKSSPADPKKFPQDKSETPATETDLVSANHADLGSVNKKPFCESNRLPENGGVPKNKKRGRAGARTVISVAGKGAKYGEGSAVVLEKLLRAALEEKRKRSRRRFRFDPPQ